MASIYDHLPPPSVSPAATPASKPRVLIVDDQPINVKLLERKLEREGMDSLIAENGRRCVEMALELRPDLILLDVMMPEMDGMEACRILRSRAETREIPVIFITARSGRDGKLEGLGAGAVDYIVKPVDLDETMARVRTHLRMREYHRENLALQARLAEARRQALVGQLTLGLSHNLNNLLGIVVGYLDLLRAAPESRASVERSAAGMDRGLRRIRDVIAQVIRLGEHTRPALFPASLVALLRNATETFRADHDYRGALRIELGVPDAFRFPTDAPELVAALVRLLRNACESVERLRGAEPDIVVAAELAGDGPARRLIIRISDNGAGIEPALKETLFEPFISVKSDVGAGMGLPLARHAIERLGGVLTLENLPAGGAVATVSLPAATA